MLPWTGGVRGLDLAVGFVLLLSICPVPALANNSAAAMVGSAAAKPSAAEFLSKLLLRNTQIGLHSKLIPPKLILKGAEIPCHSAISTPAGWATDPGSVDPTPFPKRETGRISAETNDKLSDDKTQVIYEFVQTFLTMTSGQVKTSLAVTRPCASVLEGSPRRDELCDSRNSCNKTEWRRTCHELSSVFSDCW